MLNYQNTGLLRIAVPVSDIPESLDYTIRSIGPTSMSISTIETPKVPTVEMSHGSLRSDKQLRPLADGGYIFE